MGELASLQVINSNEKTMFQAIYMGHDAGSENMTPYRGDAVVNLDAKAAVRGKVDVSRNSQAQVTVSGGKEDYAKAKAFSGNEHTTLTVRGCSVSNAVLEQVGNLVLADQACLMAKSGKFQNVTLLRGGCLDLNDVDNKDVTICGDFNGVSEQEQERGILVANEQSTLAIRGKVTGITQFQTYGRLFPGSFQLNHPYISAAAENADASNFVLSENSIGRGYQLDYDNESWNVTREIYFYELVYSCIIRSEYWESHDPDVLQKMHWGNSIALMSSVDHPGKYFLRAFEGAKTGDYTFLFFSEL